MKCPIHTGYHPCNSADHSCQSACYPRPHYCPEWALQPCTITFNEHAPSHSVSNSSRWVPHPSHRIMCPSCKASHPSHRASHSSHRASHSSHRASHSSHRGPRPSNRVMCPSHRVMCPSHRACHSSHRIMCLSHITSHSSHKGPHSCHKGPHPSHRVDSEELKLEEKAVWCQTDTKGAKQDTNCHGCTASAGVQEDNGKCHKNEEKARGNFPGWNAVIRVNFKWREMMDGMIWQD